MIARLAALRSGDAPPAAADAASGPASGPGSLEGGEWISFDVGPSNDEFVPLDQISPYLVKSIMSTEDNAFYEHHGGKAPFRSCRR